MHRFLYIILLFGTLLPVSCSRSGAAIAEMERAEALMDSLPDSALAVMRGIAPRTLHGSEARALYALTMSRALDRNDIFVASDSIIAPAVGHYRPDRDPLRHTMTQYYLGRTLFHAGDYGNSIIAYLEGLETAKNDSLSFWAGMNARELATCFNYLKYYGEEIKYEKESYQAFKRINRKPHLQYSILDIALAYHNLQEYDSARYYAAKAVESADAINNTDLSEEANKVLAWSSYALSEYSDAIDAFKKFTNTCEDSAIMALSFAELGDIEKSKKILNDISDKEQRLSNLVLYEIQKKNKDYYSALSSLEKIHHNTENYFGEATGNRITRIIADNFNNIQKAKDAEIKSNKTIIALIAVCALLSILFILLCFVFYRRISRNRLNEKIHLIDDFRRTLASSSHDLADARETVKILMRTKYDVFNHVVTLINTSKTNGVSADNFNKLLNDLLESIMPGSPEYLTIEDFVNRNNGNIVANLRSDLPKLKAVDYALFTFTVIGFSISTISTLLGENDVSKVYSRKRRLKDRISGLDSDCRERYLEVLG